MYDKDKRIADLEKKNFDLSNEKRMHRSALIEIKEIEAEVERFGRILSVAKFEETKELESKLAKAVEAAKAYRDLCAMYRAGPVKESVMRRVDKAKQALAEIEGTKDE